jgi:hypothetical protein
VEKVNKAKANKAKANKAKANKAKANKAKANKAEANKAKANKDKSCEASRMASWAGAFSRVNSVVRPVLPPRFAMAFATSS